MSNQVVDPNKQLEDQVEIGVMHDEPEQRDDQPTTPLQAEIGAVHNEPEQRADQGTVPLPKEIGVVKNAVPGTGEPAVPEIGRTRNEAPGKK
jgi:hypothetical protein